MMFYDRKITVLMPVYNEENYLKYSIESVLKQTYKNYDFIIINDGSTDNSENIILQYAEIDSRIKYYKLSRSGFAKALNFGLNVSETDIIIRMDADDIALPQLLESQLKYFLNSGMDLAGCSLCFFSGKRIIYSIKYTHNSKEIKKYLSLYSLLQHTGLIFKKEILISNGGYVETERNVDYATWLKIKNRVTFGINPEVLFFCRYRTNSLSRTNIKKFYDNHYRLQEPYYKNSLIEEFGVKDKYEELIFRGWREYFYGKGCKAREYWKKALNIKLIDDYRVYLAYILSYLPENVLLKIKELRLKFRIKYYILYFSSENIKLRKLLKEHLQN